jgi:hypothetical protein
MSIFKKLPFNEDKKSSEGSESPKDEYPKINTIGVTVPYKHTDSSLSGALGLSDKDTKTMALKFQAASEKAKLGGSSGYISRTVEIVLPTLNGQELAFCVGAMVAEKVKLEKRFSEGDISGLLDMLGLKL